MPKTTFQEISVSLLFFANAAKESRAYDCMRKPIGRTMKNPEPS
jgi:hypothetical protein